MTRMNVGKLAAVLAVLFVLPCCTPEIVRAQDAVKPLADKLRPYVQALSGKLERCEFRGRLEVPIDGDMHTIECRLARWGDDAFDLELTHADYALTLRRRKDVTAFALPKHQVVFLGRGNITNTDHLKPLGLPQRLVTSRTSVATYANLLLHPEPEAVVGLLGFLGGTFDVKTQQGRVGKDVSFRFDKDGGLIVDAGKASLRLSMTAEPAEPADADEWPAMKMVDIPRDELERQLVRGVRRALQIFAPSKLLTDPQQQARRTPHGELRWIEGQRIVLLAGTPEQIGQAHAELLKAEAQACMDSVLYTFGTVQTVRTGRWFRHDLDAAYARLSPHIPERHKVETRALAAALDVDAGLAEALNVFPELFHCSGFALFGKATRDGKLYHGRVLDYMTTIGLQDAATTFVVQAEGQIPFVNVGYAGFIGSVSGMNARAISLGEMGGGGEGQWDGAPMATLMRRALEECSTLDEVMQLWKQSPRTCEYYYVFADGKTNQAVGVAATPESIEFVHPGQAHPLLGDGIEDAVVLSAGSRLEKLRERVQEKHGQVDAELARWLMCRPVAMQSNLHNVLFVPEDGILYVANASHSRPAAEQPYVRLDLHELLRSIASPTPAGKPVASE